MISKTTEALQKLGFFGSTENRNSVKNIQRGIQKMADIILESALLLASNWLLCRVAVVAMLGSNHLIQEDPSN